MSTLTTLRVFTQAVCISKFLCNFKMHLGLWEISYLSQAKPLNCNQVLGHVADQNYIVLIDTTEHYQTLSSVALLQTVVASCQWLLLVTTKNIDEMKSP